MGYRRQKTFDSVSHAPALRTKTLLILGGLGAIVHLLLVRCIAYLWYQPPADRSFVNNLFVNVGLSVLGGVFYALLLRLPVLQFARTGRNSVLTLFNGGLLGAIATFAAFQGLYLGTACFLALKGKAVVPEVQLWTAFLLAVMDIETYGLLAIVEISLPAFLCGALVTAVVVYLILPHSLPPMDNPT